jgi:phosphoribosylformylglycinamidine cyclo-ligase
LIGGETAEMPGVYTPPDYDLAGFIVGCVDEDAILGSSRVQNGDVLVGLESSGLHTNGYSLARRIISDRLHLGVSDTFPGENGTVADVLLAVHRSYLATLKPLLSTIHAMAHITGGGLPGNLNRALPQHLDAVVDTSTWEAPNVFRQLEKAGGVDRAEMFRTFNMGVGMVVFVSEAAVEGVVQASRAAGLHAWRLGNVTNGAGQVVLT